MVTFKSTSSSFAAIVKPNLLIGTPNLELLPQILMSQHPAISNPPPTHIPSIKAIVGIGQSKIAPSVPCKNLP